MVLKAENFLIAFIKKFIFLLHLYYIYHFHIYLFYSGEIIFF